jgi:hypothetical protein
MKCWNYFFCNNPVHGHGLSGQIRFCITEPCSTNILSNYLGSEVLTAMVMNTTFFWIATPCSLVDIHRRFWVKNRLHLQVVRVSHARNQQEASSSSCLLLLAWLTLRPGVFKLVWFAGHCKTYNTSDPRTTVWIITQLITADSFILKPFIWYNSSSYRPDNKHTCW